MRTAQGLVFLLVSVCCDTHSPRLGVLAGVSVLWYVQPKIWWSFWCQCVVIRTAQDLVVFLVSVLWYVQPKAWWSCWCQCVVIRTAQGLVVLLVSVCCDTYSPRFGGLAGVSVLWYVQPKAWWSCWCQCVVMRTAQVKAENSEVKGFYKADVNGYWTFVVYVVFFKLLPVSVVRYKE